MAKRLLPHLENALRLARRWTRAEFQSLFVDHPLTHNVTRRPVWGVYAANEPRRLLTAFRIAAEGEFCDDQMSPSPCRKMRYSAWFIRWKWTT